MKTQLFLKEYDAFAEEDYHTPMVGKTISTVTHIQCNEETGNHDYIGDIFVTVFTDNTFVCLTVDRRNEIRLDIDFIRNFPEHILFDCNVIDEAERQELILARLKRESEMAEKYRKLEEDKDYKVYMELKERFESR